MGFYVEYISFFSFSFGRFMLHVMLYFSWANIAIHCNCRCRPPGKSLLSPLPFCQCKLCICTLRMQLLSTCNKIHTAKAMFNTIISNRTQYLVSDIILLFYFLKYFFFPFSTTFAPHQHVTGMCSLWAV